MRAWGIGLDLVIVAANNLKVFFEPGWFCFRTGKWEPPLSFSSNQKASESHGSQEQESEEFFKNPSGGGSGGPKVDWFIGIFVSSLCSVVRPLPVSES